MGGEMRCGDMVWGGGRAGPGGKKLWPAIKAVERRSAASAIRDVTSDAGSFGKELLAGNDGIGASAGRAGKPCGIVRRLHDGDPAAHQGMVGAAVLRAKEVVTAGLPGPEPHSVVMPGDDVHLHAER